VKLAFVNRGAELRELDMAAKRGGLLVVYGRRRVGKTRLLRHWLQRHDGLYTQAIEAQSDLQIAQVVQDLGPQLETKLVPRSWSELLELLAGHAASALISSKLYSMTDRKLRTIEGFMSLLRVTQGGGND
jgi:AAA+ ATPase superfamily predicted ATPase